ncbi:MAG: AAA family ATPase [Saprospiraceae bacterium]|nr:AAA family ATPase [Saprospiraceae bacterium]
MVGRKTQLAILKQHLKTPRSSFLAVTGRRRVGKTYLVDQVYQGQICFRITGLQDGSLHRQLVNFGVKLAEHNSTPYIAAPSHWQEAFIQLKSYTQSLSKKRKWVIFFDELPWITTAKSGFLQLLAHFWNDYLSKESNFILVICGSATSWITKKVINDRGGLHNRITQTIHLHPFTLSETKEFLISRKINLTNQSIAQLYMVMGGIPFYLENIKKGESPSATIDRMCFSDTGILKSEYQNLYRALFKDAANHETIVKVLSASSQGLTRQEILKKSKIPSGGPYNRTMEDLLVSGFINEYNPFGRKKRGSLYRLADEYSIFYHRFIFKQAKYTKDIWLQLSATQSYKIWCGYAFESICLKHIQAIKDALGISSVYAEISSLRIHGNKNTKGFQIDLILDRKDNTINLCEMKFYAKQVTIDRELTELLRKRKQLFIDVTDTKKQIFTTLITNHGVEDNEYAKEIMDSQVHLDQLF